MITARLNKYKSMASVVPYTLDELKSLHDLTMYSEELDTLNNMSLDTALHEYIHYGKIDLSLGGGAWLEVTLEDMHVNFMQFLLVYYRKVFLFLMCVPIERISLYINHQGLRVFARWRLSIRK